MERNKKEKLEAGRRRTLKDYEGGNGRNGSKVGMREQVRKRRECS